MNEYIYIYIYIIIIIKYFSTVTQNDHATTPQNVEWALLTPQAVNLKTIYNVTPSTLEGNDAAGCRISVAEFMKLPIHGDANRA